MDAIPTIPAARPSIPSIRLTELIDPKTPMITTGMASRPKLKPPNVVTAPVNPKNIPKTTWLQIFSNSSGSVLIGTSPITSTFPSLSKSSTSAFAFGVATRTSSPGSTSSLPKVMTSSEMFTTIF